jgi:hypothetical protein
VLGTPIKLIKRPIKMIKDRGKPHASSPVAHLLALGRGQHGVT